MSYCEHCEMEECECEMLSYEVNGQATVNVKILVEASSEEEAIERANEELSSLTAYCGNGGVDRLIGVDGEGQSVECWDYIDWTDAYVQ